MRAFHDQHPEQFAETEAVRPSHILIIETPSEAAPAGRNAALNALHPGETGRVEAGGGIRRMLVEQARQALTAELGAGLRAAGEIETYP